MRQVSTGGGVEPLWLPSGEPYYRRGDAWYVTRVSADEELRWEPPRIAFETDFIDTPGMSYDVSADGQHLLVVKGATPTPTTRIEIVTNWPALLESAGPAN